MELWQAIIIGLLQGLTEFLPISSSGHLILAGRILDVNISLSLELFMHLATLLSVVIVMFKPLKNVIAHPVKNKTFRLLVIACIPCLIVALILKGLLEDSMDGRLLPYCFLITAIVLLTCSFVKKQSKKELGYLDALIIGTVQGIAVLPGISRSGSTISASLLLGNEKEKGCEFSFLLSIPIILFSSVTILPATSGIEFSNPLPLLAGFITAFISGFFSLRFMLKKVVKSFDYFAIYLLALSVLLFLNDMFLSWF